MLSRGCHLWLPSPRAFSALVVTFIARVQRACVTFVARVQRAWSWNAMTILDLIVLLIIAGICGALGQAITGFTRGGCLVAIALGFIGALLGMWLARQLGLPELLPVQIGSTSFPVVWSIIGSALFVAVISLLTRPRP
ncbi:MAG TPA: GlsB/YeaQ/YmgE family stress response membrane protein [Pyrinomonadaceae bacterium]|jgi:uncharacterized membrane protein YeaQ/YmgE (transglycosylase-associated protein family)